MPQCRCFGAKRQIVELKLSFAFCVWPPKHLCSYPPMKEAKKPGGGGTFRPAMHDSSGNRTLIYERITRPRRRGRPATAAAAAAAAAATAYAPLPSTSQRRRRRGRPSVADAAAAAAATDAATHAATDAAALVATNTAALSCKFC
ncbi:uncharacterized protein LOC112590510 isoform X2 [Harpegnathos saltator]|uniref:uncharacterized protein LOC112590510 isoform X2 n=1 Tax=Harpegnathos saltator TaxID=610380 RepID=UPI000DBEEFF8|nr:uncharacterized protein LOC112590510 isoform X2 [Harpegnathos saltator]